MKSSSRLIAAESRSEQGVRVLRAGVEIALEPGWKTYWRYPGDSGVPPVFDFSGSTNIKAVTVLWPAPTRFADGAGGVSIGYKGTVTLPLNVVAADESKPVTLRMHVDYGACERLCIPAKGRAELALGNARTGHERALDAAQARVPAPAKIGGVGPLAIRSVAQQITGGKAQVIVDVAAPAGVVVDLFVEGPTPDWALPLPSAVAAAPNGVKRFAFDVDGLPPGVKPAGALLTLTAVAGDAAIETAFRLD